MQYFLHVLELKRCNGCGSTELCDKATLNSAVVYWDGGGLTVQQQDPDVLTKCDLEPLGFNEGVGAEHVQFYVM